MKPNRLKGCLSLSLMVSAHALAAAPTVSCASLATLSIPNTIIQSATVDGGTVQLFPTYAAAGSMPQNCVVKGIIEQRTGVTNPDTNSNQYGTSFELRLPTSWSGRFFYQGGQGDDGYLSEADGLIISQAPSQQIPALWRGYAVVTSDAGHSSGTDQTAVFKSGFGVDPKARIDYGYRSIGTVTQVAKTLIATYYGNRPNRSYFVGCSKGGQEALQAGQRYGDQFDGIVAGDPGMHLPQAAVNQVWDTQVLAKTAKTMSPLSVDYKTGKPLLTAAFSSSDLDLVSNAIAQACDTLDGLADGLIFRPEACQKTFNPASLQCSGAKNASCLASVQVDALKKIMGGAMSSTGKPLFNSFFYDTGVNSGGFAGWVMWKLGTRLSLTNTAMNISIGQGSVSYVFNTPPNPNLDIFAANIDAADAATRTTGTDPNTGVLYDTSAVNFMYSDNPNLDTLQARGGKVIIYHGASDPVFSIVDTLNYYNSLKQRYGALTTSFARAFIVPGMGHCLDGSRTANSFDTLTAIENWVERGVAPDRLIATPGNAALSSNSLPANVTRPLCPYPQYARFIGFGDSNDANNFFCANL